MMLSNNVLDFYSFLNEAKTENIKVVVLTGNVTGSKTSDSFAKECKKRGIKCYIVDVNLVTVEKVYNGHLLKTGKEKILIDPNSTAIVPRRGVLENSYTKQILLTLEEARYFTVNTIASMEACENKFTTSQIMEANGLPVPKSALVPDENSLDKALEAIGGKFPVIMKLLSGTQGIGVSIIDSYASLKSVYQTIRKLDESNEILIQEKIDSNYDLRIQVIVKKFNPDPRIVEKNNSFILGTMKRGAVKKDFRTNYSLGGTVNKFKITKELSDIAIKAANAVGCHWCGVDIMIDSKTKKPYILEVNSSPGTEGISKAIGKPIVDDVLDYIVNKNNWTYSNMEIGYLETLNIPKIGDIIAKFDTGNGSKSCTIHADKVEEKNGKVYWSVGGKRFVNPIVGHSEPEIGTEKTRRPIIEMDILFNGVLVPNVMVSPDNRTDKSTPFLVNREFMRMVGSSVNPNKAFVVTKNTEDKFSLKNAKGNPYAGIKFKNENKYE
jgi:ribosomal protein S6--L-glutamate ligase